MMWGWWDGGWGWLWMSLSMVAFWALVVALIVWGVRALRAPAPPERDAVAILEERFARGEIDREELEERRAALRR